MSSHKYTEREWKNGKWIYTYPEEINDAVKKETAARDIRMQDKEYSDRINKMVSGKSKLGTTMSVKDKDGNIIYGKHKSKDDYKTRMLEKGYSDKVNSIVEKGKEKAHLDSQKRDEVVQKVKDKKELEQKIKTETFKKEHENRMKNKEYAAKVNYIINKGFEKEEYEGSKRDSAIQKGKERNLIMDKEREMLDKVRERYKNQYKNKTNKVKH